MASTLSTVYLLLRVLWISLTLRNSFGVVRVVVDGSPVGPADVAELMGASARHMVAALILLNDDPALPTAFVLQIVHQKLNLPIVAVSRMLAQKALTAETTSALVAGHRFLLRPSFGLPNDPFAGFARTHFESLIVENQVKVVDFSVLFLHVHRQLFEELSISVERSVAVRVGTDDFLKLADQVNRVLVQTRFAVASLVATVRNKDFLCLFALLQTDLALESF